MRPAVSDRDLEDAEVAASLDPRAQHALADLLESWASTPHPADTVSAGRLLVAASEHRAYAGDAEAALALARRAVATGDEVAPDIRCYVVSALLACGRAQEAWALSQQVVAERVGDGDAHAFLGEAFAWHGEAEAASQVFARGVFGCTADAEVVEALLGAWRRSRRGGGSGAAVPGAGAVPGEGSAPGAGPAPGAIVDLRELPGQRVRH